jgi:hypothetical protein
MICDFLRGELDRQEGEVAPAGDRPPLQADLVVEAVNRLFRDVATYRPQTVF